MSDSANGDLERECLRTKGICVGRRRNGRYSKFKLVVLTVGPCSVTRYCGWRRNSPRNAACLFNSSLCKPKKCFCADSDVAKATGLFRDLEFGRQETPRPGISLFLRLRWAVNRSEKEPRAARTVANFSRFLCITDEKSW